MSDIIPREFLSPAEALPRDVIAPLTEHCAKMLRASELDHAAKPFRTFIREFDWERDRSVPWVPEHMAPLYGTPFYAGLSDEQKLVLNHMGWVGHYQYSIIGERLLAVPYNNASASVFDARGYDIVAEYLRRESSEELDHSATFQHIGDIVETAYYGRPRLFERLSAGYDFPEQGFQGFGPWRAVSFYYWMRGHQNISLRGNERELKRVNNDGTVARITREHFEDETRHYATSHVVAQALEQIDDGQPPPLRLAYVCRLSVNGSQACANWIWPSVRVVPGFLIPELAELLLNPVFRLQPGDILEILRDAYTHRPANPQWEAMRHWALRPTCRHNERVSWVPPRLGDPEQVAAAMKFNIDAGLPFARAAFEAFSSQWSERWGLGQPAAWGRGASMLHT